MPANQMSKFEVGPDPVYPASATMAFATDLPITSPSFRLRHFVLEDAPAIMALNAEESTRCWLPSHLYPSAEAAAASLGYLISCYAVPGNPNRAPFVLAVEHRDTGRLLGHVGFSPLHGEVEVSYAIAEAFRRRGYGVQALAHACNWVACTFAVPQIVAITAPGNVASRRTLELATFTHLRDEQMLFQGSQQTVSRYTWQPPVKCSGT